MSALTFEGVAVRYGHGSRASTVVQDVDLEVGSGEILGLVGESGSGKSTLARAAVGLCEPSAGRILLDGRQVDHATGERLRLRRRIQMVFQDPTSCLDPRRTVAASLDEALVAGARRDGTDPGGPQQRRATATELLGAVQLPAELADRMPSQLSGGQRQRVAIARAVAAGPSVVLADEITSALDVSVQGAVLNQLLALQRARGFAMLFISHNLAVVRLVCDRVAVLRQGRLVEQGPVTEVLTAPAQEYTRRLIAAVPSLPPVPGIPERAGQQDHQDVRVPEQEGHR